MSALRWMILSAALAILATRSARAEGAEAPLDDASVQVARDVAERYLAFVKSKKWAEAKKLTHPMTLKVIAERKKRLGREDHPMAPWASEKVAYLKQFKLTSARPSALGTVVVETSEDNFQVEEKGIAEGEMAAYLLGKVGGKWMVVDKKRGESFTDASIRLAYKGYF